MTDTEPGPTDAGGEPVGDLELFRPNGVVRPAWLAGWREHIDLPKLGAYRLVAKLDTGARTSSLHARELHRNSDRSGRTWLTMELLAPEEDAGADPRGRNRDATADPDPDGDPSPDPTDAGRWQQPPQAAGAPPGNTSAEDRDLVVPPGPVRARWVADRMIRSSNGVEELRPVIRTTVALGGHRWACEMTLAERGSMGHPVLLGRTAIRRRFLVHPGRSFLADAPSVIAGAGGV